MRHVTVRRVVVAETIFITSFLKVQKKSSSEWPPCMEQYRSILMKTAGHTAYSLLDVHYVVLLFSPVSIATIVLPETIVNAARSRHVLRI